MIKHTYTTFQIAKIFDVFPSTVADWIDGGELEGYTTPGGHRRVTRKSLISFMNKQGKELPFEFQKRDRNLKMLIVDDDLQIRDVIYRSLNGRFPQASLYLASDGFEAGHEIALHKPDIVILDLMLPGINGFKICSLIKQTYTHTKVLAITGFDTEEFRERISAIGADMYMAKPLDLGELNTVVNDLVHGSFIKGKTHGQ